MKIQISLTLSESLLSAIEQLLEKDETISDFAEKALEYYIKHLNIKTPNKITEKTLTYTDAGKNLVRCENTEDMFRKLGI